jgi:hypothetical protein
MFPQDTIQKDLAIPFGRLRIARGGELPDQMEMTLSCFPAGLWRTIEGGADLPSD